MATSSETTSEAVGYFRAVDPTPQTGEENQYVVGTGWGTKQDQLAWREQQADQLWVLLPPSGPRPSNGNRRVGEAWIETWHGKPTQSDVARGETRWWLRVFVSGPQVQFLGSFVPMLFMEDSGNALTKPQSGSEEAQ